MHINISDTVKKRLLEYDKELNIQSTLELILREKEILSYKYPEKILDNILDKTNLSRSNDNPLKIATFTSGTGCMTKMLIDLEKYLERTEGYSPFNVSFIFDDTKNPDGLNMFFQKSDIFSMAKEYNISYFQNDIDEYYKFKGYSGKADSSLSKEKRKELRESFDSLTLTKMNEMSPKIDLIVLDYYWSLCSKKITDNYLAINSHLGDLSLVGEDGKRTLTGFYPVSKAISMGKDRVYSTTHIINEKVDDGPLLLRSNGIELNLDRLFYLFDIDQSIKDKVGYLTENKEKMCIIEDYCEYLMRDYSDKIVLPLTTLLIAERKFQIDDLKKTYFNGNLLEPVAYI